MKFVQNEYTITYEIKKSKFIAYLFPYTKFDDTLKKLQQEHPKARHFVYAYRYLNQFDQVVENSSDDGEPKGTSGKPALFVLAGEELINSGVIIVRYFGGIKLGTGGLVRAYSEAVNQVVQSAVLQPYQKQIEKKVICRYTDLGKLEYFLAKYGIIALNKEFENDVTLTMKSGEEQFCKLKATLNINFVEEIK